MHASASGCRCRVTKIERHGGESARHYDSAALGTSAYFAWLNRGKESLELGIKEENVV
ncbi:MAG: CoA transferase [Rhodobacteraceae bacterium]|nr:CoA transferase [Paracoccaceae bacterium]